MALVVPNPSVPTNGQALDASPLLANLNAIYQAIQSFDASQIAAGTLVASAFNSAINPNTMNKENSFPFVVSGMIWTTVSGLNGTMTSGVQYINGIRVPVNSVASNTFTASKDTYVDIDVNGNITYQAVANGAASPALTVNSNRIAKIITGASITSIIQYGLDTMNTTGSVNYIYNTSPSAAPVTSFVNPGTAGGTFYYKNQSGVKEFWGFATQVTGNSSGGSTGGLSFPANFFNTITAAMCSVMGTATTNNMAVNWGNGNGGVSTAGGNLNLYAAVTTTAVYIGVYVRGL